MNNKIKVESTPGIPIDAQPVDMNVDTSKAILQNPRPEGDSGIDHLEEYQLEMIRLLKEGVTKPTIAEKVGKSPFQVRSFFKSPEIQLYMEEIAHDEKEANGHLIRRVASKILNRFETIIDDEDSSGALVVKIGIEFLKGAEIFKNGGDYRKQNIFNNFGTVNGKDITELSESELQAEIDNEISEIKKLSGPPSSNTDKK